MKSRFQFGHLENAIVHDKKLLYTLISYVTVLVIFVNQTILHFLGIGATASAVYFLINGTFLGRAFFEKEELFLRLLSGNLLLIVLLGLVGWFVLIAYGLDVIGSTSALLMVSTASSLSSRKVRQKNVAR